METKSPVKEASMEHTRKSLIAISYTLPDNASGPKAQPESSECGDDDALEKYRSQLISISDAQSNIEAPQSSAQKQVP
ncbi:hypothetical protein CDL15_Pgr018680 [Punica granatum]|uniref:Uncharacterized protein n=1 Tax=Punica granatum TaxID=22663 RepID=A0A218VV09_PUNGR|nr:hypothetical protein CDL15_Pgr018680 [Punica granatum]